MEIPKNHTWTILAGVYLTSHQKTSAKVALILDSVFKWNLNTKLSIVAQTNAMFKNIISGGILTHLHFQHETSE
jgi:hypothetical protein